MDRRARSTKVVGILLSTLLLPASARADAPFPVFDPHSARARAIVDLTWFVLVLVAIVFVLTEAALVYFIIRYRHRGETGEPRQIAGNRRLEFAWTAIPVLLLAVVFVLTARTMHTVDAAGTPALTVEVTGHQWWWEYRYPDQGIITANELHLPVGQDVRLRLTSGDVIHDFWVPQLGRKMDLVPGQVNEITLRADRPGTYRGACAEYCGTQHAWMRLLVIADPPDQFAAWLEGQRQPPELATDPVAARGRQFFATGAGNCAACHTVAGYTSGQVGPDLTHIDSRTTLGAGVLTNNSDNLTRWLANPQAVKPGNRMPNPRLSTEEVQALVAYLTSLK